MPVAFDMQFDNAIVQEIIYTVVALVFVALLARLASRIIARYVEEPVRRYKAIRLARRFSSVVLVALIVIIWSPGQQNVLTFLTIVGAGLAIAMREALLSVVGWMNLVVRGQFRQGDRIEVNGVHGDVVDVRLMHSTMMEIQGWVDADQSTGRLVHFPNSWIFQHAVYNYNREFSFIWNEIPLVLTFRSDWAAAREIMQSLAEESAAIVEQQAAHEIRRMSREYLVHYGILTPFVYVNIRRDGVGLTLRYLCEARKRRGTQHALSIEILRAFATHGNIELAYGMVGLASIEGPQFQPENLTNTGPSSHGHDRGEDAIDPS